MMIITNIRWNRVEAGQTLIPTQINIYLLKFASLRDILLKNKKNYLSIEPQIF